MIGISPITTPLRAIDGGAVPVPASQSRIGDRSSVRVVDGCGAFESRM
jgi:hypothetical protein